MITPLPIVQSIPHGGLESPAILRDLLVQDATAIYNECDLWADQLYNFAENNDGGGRATLATVTTAIARGIVDVNRPPDDLRDPDGAVKLQSSYGARVWQRPLTDDEQARLLERCWSPFHATLARTMAAQRDIVRLFLDCHTMAQRGPTTYAFAGEARPLLCLANLGDREGERLAGGEPLSCPPELLHRAALLAEEHFAGLTLLEPDGAAPPTVALNWPFAGGYILRRYTESCAPTTPPMDLRARAPLGIMVEVNRGLYVGNQHGSTPPGPPNMERIGEIRRRLRLWAAAVCAELE